MVEDKNIGVGVFSEAADYALGYLEDEEREGRLNAGDLCPVVWVGSLCTANGLGAFKVETHSKDPKVRDVLDGLLGFVEIMASMSGLCLACVETPQAKRVFVYHPELISKESLEKGRYYTYVNLTRESLGKMVSANEC